MSKSGAPKGNQNAKRLTTKNRMSFRLDDEVKSLILMRAKQLGISQAAYLARLVAADNSAADAHRGRPPAQDGCPVRRNGELKASGLSNQAIADKLGVDPSYITKLLK